jgi:hypothetical protein
MVGLTVACAGTLYSTFQGAGPSAPDAVYDCVRDHLTRVGYERSQYDPTRRWYVARKADPTIHVSSGTFRRALNVLDTTVEPDSSGNSSIKVTARTIYQYDLERGLTDVEESASATVKADAAALIQACTQGS